VCREYQIAQTLYYQWRGRLLDGGKAASANPREKTPEQAELA
jgi:transposase